MEHVITISRQYGSGGRELGERLAKELGIPLYDKELINLIAEREKKGPCVIVGRCADVILPDSVRLFVYADLDCRIGRIRSRQGLTENEARKKIRKMDNSRRDYRRFYCERDWGILTDYDLCINIGKVGPDRALATVPAYVK